MKLYIKQKVFSLGERFYVKDEAENDVYYVEGSFFRIPKKFEIFTLDDKLVVTIERQMFRLQTHYNITTYDETVTIKRNFTFLRKRFQVLEKNWSVQGDFLAHNYDITSGLETIMHIQKHWFTWGDSYELNINKSENALLALAIVIVVDASMTQSSQVSVSTST